MMAWGYDRREGMALVALSLEKCSPEELRAELTEASKLFTRLDEECHTHPQGPVFLTIIQGDSVMPDATTRKALAETARRLRSARHCAVLVTSSRIFRGILQAITWLAPPRAGHSVCAVDSVSQAHEEAEKFRGERLPVLRALTDKALADLSLRPLSRPRSKLKTPARQARPDEPERSRMARTSLAHAAADLTASPRATNRTQRADLCRWRASALSAKTVEPAESLLTRVVMHVFASSKDSGRERKNAVEKVARGLETALDSMARWLTR